MKKYGEPRTNNWSVLENAQPPKLYEKDSMIYFQGEKASYFYYLKKGSVKIFLSSPDGMEKTLRLLDRGIFGEASFFDRLPRVSSAKTLEPSEIVVISRKTLMACFKKEPELAMNLLQYLAETVRMLSSQVDSMAFLQADRRIARLLSDLSEPGKDGSVVHCTHEEIGNLAGVSRVTVIRVLDGFSAKGWLETRYRSIVIRDQKALFAFAFGGKDITPPPF